MSLKAKMEAVIYAAEEPVTLAQLVGLLGQEAQAELDAAAAQQGRLSLTISDAVLLKEVEAGDQDALNAETLGLDSFAAVAPADPDTTELLSGQEASPSILVREETAAPPREEAREDITQGGPSGPSASAGGAELTAAAQRARERDLREYMRGLLDELIAEYAGGDRGLEIREVAGGFRLATKPEYHDAVRGFVRSLKPPLKLSLQALETLAVVAYKQPVTAPEVSEIRGVDTAGVLGSLITRKLVTTAGRKQVIGRPILYKTTREFLLRFGLRDLSELPSIEEFERLAADLTEAVQEEISMPEPTEVPVGTVVDRGPLSVADVELEMEPSRDVHAAQADGDPNGSAGFPDEVDAEHLSPAPDLPGEFTGDESAPPADNVEVDGRNSGVPPTYDTPGDDMMDSPEHDAEVQGSEEGSR